MINGKKISKDINDFHDKMNLLWQNDYMDTSQHVRSHLRGTGPSSYGTGPILVDNLGPVPSYSKQYNFSYFLAVSC